MRLLKSTIIMAMVCALMGVMTTASSVASPVIGLNPLETQGTPDAVPPPANASGSTASASTYDDGSTCDHIADARGNIALTLTAGLKRLTGSFALNGEIVPIPQNGGTDATQAVNSYTWSHCQQGARFSLTVTTNGKRVLKRAWTASSDPSTGKIQMSESVNKKYAPLTLFQKVSYRLKGFIWDKDQTITYVDQRDSLRSQGRTFVVEI